MKKTNHAPNIRLKDARERRGWTQQNVADLIDAPRSYLVSRWESGSSRPSKFYLQKLTEVFHLTTEELGFYQAVATEQNATASNPSYRNIAAIPPTTDPEVILQRQSLVEQIYTCLIQENLSSVVITGISGIGKSTLSALVYQYVEQQKYNKNAFFKARALWLRIAENTSFLDIMYTIFHALNIELRDSSGAPPHLQARTLFEALHTLPCLIVLDQFENLLDMQTGYALEQHQAIAEWLDLLNSHTSLCRILFTSRVQPHGIHGLPPLHMKHYELQGLDSTEGTLLLRKRGARGDEAALQEAVRRCEGHAYALALLAALLEECQTSVPQVLKDASLWRDDISTVIINTIVKSLSPVLLTMLRAFSVYREAVPLEAIYYLLPHIPEKSILQALREARKHYLLHLSGDRCFQIHAIIAEYLKSTDHGDDKQCSLPMLHAGAARYYLQQAVTIVPARQQRRTITDTYLFIEALWHLCHAEQRQQAYELIEQEALFADLHLCGGDLPLLEIYQLLLPLDTWSCPLDQALHIYRQLGAMYHALGQHGQAQEYYTQALLTCRLLGNRSEEWDIHLQSGIILDDLSEPERAWQQYTEALRISEEINDPKGKAQALSLMGWVANCQKQFEQAERYLQEALSFFALTETTEDGCAWTALRLGIVYETTGQHERALQQYTGAMALFKKVGNQSGEAWTLMHRAETHRASSQYQQGIADLEEGRAIFRAVNGYRGETWLLYHLALIYRDLRDTDTARKYLLTSLKSFEELRDTIGRDMCQEQLDRLCIA